MTPNLESARHAIQAELMHAKQGVEFYAARVEALETALSQLETVDVEEARATRKNTRKSANVRGTRNGASTSRQKARASESEVNKAAAKGASRRGRPAGKDAHAQTGKSLPTTGVEFWLKLVTGEPRSAVDIANAAVREIGLKPDQKDQIQKLKQRVAPALATLVSAGKVHDSGVGRQRRFFIGEGSAKSS